MRRLLQYGLCIILLIGSTGYGQSLADAARENRTQKSEKSAASAKVIGNDDLFPTPSVIQLVPGSSSTGQGRLVAPGRGKHDYQIIMLDATRFVHGGTLHISISTGDGPAEASFDLYPQGALLSASGFPTSIANAHNVPRTSGATINYRFAHGTVFQFGAEGSWNEKTGAANTYSFVVSVDDQSAQ